MQSFDDALFTMTSFSAKKLEKATSLGEEKKYKCLKWPQKFVNNVLH